MWVDSKVASALSPSGSVRAEIRQPHRWTPSVGPNNFAIDDVKRFGPRLHQSRRQHSAHWCVVCSPRVSMPRHTSRSRARRTPPMPRAILSVWPWITRILA